MVFQAFVDTALQSAGEHPLTAAWLAVVFGLVVLLGGLHVCRVFVRFLVVIVQEVKHELAGGWEAVRRLARELTTWKSDP
jgi:hypothetical protein